MSETEILKEFDRYIDSFHAVSSMLNKRSPVYGNPGVSSSYARSVVGGISFLDMIFGMGNIFSANLQNKSSQFTPDGASAMSGIMVAAQEAYQRSLKFSKMPNTKTHVLFYVNMERIEALKNITSHDFDLTRLIRLCEELNIAYQNESHMTVAMIVRSIIDHIPPIFKVDEFCKVANNYGGSSSFKENAKALNNFLRKIANAHLHVQIRRKEVLPTDIQVDFRASLDVILSEIVRIL